VYCPPEPQRFCIRLATKLAAPPEPGA